MGFSDGSAVSERIRNWHRGRYRATRSSRARELLTELVPTLLDTLSGTASPDSAFRNFDAFLAALPAGVQLFSLLIANPNLMQLVAEIMGSAPRLATSLAAQPSLLDSVIEGDFYGPLEDRATLAESLDGTLAVARDYEDVLERSRRFANDQKFRIGMRILGGELDADSAGAALSDLADVVVAKLLEVDSADMEAKHGRVPDCGMCVVALGKLGGREITENSDLDLLLVYGSGEEGEEEDGVTNSSDGKRPLVASQYFARLAQQLITAVSAPTSEGKLYEVDMRLRPSGNAGPIATSLAAFSRYQDTQAWTWEHMALTRARVLAGPPGLGSRIAARIAEILCRPRDEKKLKDDVLEMRGRLARGHPGQSPWDVKYIDGGIIDVEFIAQYLQLYHGHAHPEVLATKTADALTALHGAGVLDSDTAVRLIQAERLWRTIQGMLRFTFEGSFDEDAAPMGLKSALVRATGMDDFNDLKLNMTNTAGWVRATFLALIGKPIQP
jgi:glutamate-ammonia-ligase adenylyltransferase